ncbi:tyrosine--tRNA ligase, mitochondrial isoform X1 [Leptopilina boulardi]|uniref:tyrosine--tRNA ligase, mitochondrial isoform X1 n=2 Tax=Leptopilina boulardi TaxID=63433 RepID=UPI0021F5F834|nr:tyrosine--tRNA ligase, mitochondrial isoform X1 [Leptopilina boulardi]
MNSKQLLRLCYTGKTFFYNSSRYYTNGIDRNILKLHERGMFEDLFPEQSAGSIKKLLIKSPQCVYSGFDPTAESLHIGNLLILMNLLHWQRSGHDVIALIGGATGLIGDPSGRNTERDQIEEVLIKENVASIKKNIETIFDNHEKYFWKDPNYKLKPIKIVNNNDWYNGVNVIEFIQRVGKHFRLGTMLGRTSVKIRMEQDSGMSFTEFSYQVFQAYDWLHLLNKYNCRFQIGGSDQMGNIVAGHDLISRIRNDQVFGITSPLITSEGGKKFGKSVGNAVWLSSKKSSSFQLYQFFIRTADSDVEKFLNLFTFLTIAEIEEIMLAHNKDPGKRDAQTILAEAVTILVHGEEGLESARKTSEILYGSSIEKLSTMNVNDLITAFEGATLVEIMNEPGITVSELAMKANCFKKQNDALRIIPAGGFHINHQKITNADEMIVPGIHIMPNNLSLIRVGKKTYHIVKWL